MVTCWHILFNYVQVQSICSEFIELYAPFDVVPITSKQIVLKPGSVIFTFEPITTGNNNGLSTAKGEPVIGGQGPIKYLKLLIVLVGVLVTVGVAVLVGVLVTVGVLVCVGVLVTVGVVVLVGVWVTVGVLVGVWVTVGVTVGVGVTG